MYYEIKTEDAYQDLWYDKDRFDNSDYPDDSQYFDKTNKKVIGKFKHEASVVPVIEFIGLKSKMYSYIKENDKGGKTAKGIKRSAIRKSIKHKDYKQRLINNRWLYHIMRTIRSDHHRVESYELNKISLSCFDDKRYISKSGITSYAYRHYKIKSAVSQKSD